MVDCTGLENRRPGNRTVGSNPTPSAYFFIMVGVPRSSFFLTNEALKGALLPLALFIAGITLGLVIPSSLNIGGKEVDWYILSLLLFLIGVSVGADRKVWAALGSARKTMLLLPLVVVAGSFVGAGTVALVLPSIPMKEAIAVSAGLGYYSLSSVFITHLRGELWGTVALLANLFRETATLLSASYLAKRFGPLAPIAAGGATAMDVTLPLIAKYSGKAYVPLAVASGATLTFLVPFLVSAILQTNMVAATVFSMQDTLQGVFSLLLMVAGGIVGVLFRQVQAVLSLVDFLTNITIGALLFFLGVGVGNNSTVLNNLSSVGVQALLIGIGATIGSVLLASLLTPMLLTREGQKSRTASHLDKMPRLS